MAPKWKKTRNGEGETSNPPPPPPQKETGEKEEIGVTIDPRLLECSICFEPLRRPVYQCNNGHIACFSCWEKVQFKCPTCKKPIGPRNIALEAMLESIYLPCPKSNFGCHQSLSYSKMQVHTKTCEFGPSVCPIPGCAHEAVSGEWKEHFMKDHEETGWDYRYGDYCCISFDEDDHYHTLLGPGKDVFLLVKEPIPNVGNVISLFYVDLADRGQNHFSYELKEYMTCISYKSPGVVSIKEWKQDEVHRSSLLVPSQVWYSRYKLHVLINKK